MQKVMTAIIAMLPSKFLCEVFFAIHWHAILQETKGHIHLLLVSCLPFNPFNLIEHSGGWFVKIKGLHLMMPCLVIWKKKLGSLSCTPHYWICLKGQYLHLYGYLWNWSLLADCAISYISTYLNVECGKVCNTFILLQTLILVWKNG
jgi:hypothetical protein